MNVFTLTRFAVLLLGFTVLFTGCDTASRTKYIKIGHALDASHPVHKAMVFMAERLKEKSGGKLQVKIYPSQQLGSERELLELLQIGSLGMTKVSTGALENFSPGMKVFGLPYLFRDRQHHFQVLDGEIGQQLLDEGQKYWLKGLCYYDAGSRSFYTTARPIEKPSDLSGLKIRVMESVTAMEMVSSLGGSPTPVSWGELYTALQQGIVDGAENNPPSFYLSHHYEVCKYYSIDEHTAMPDVLLISTVVWNSLSEQQQKWLQEAVDESVIYQREIWKEAEEEALAAVKAAGVKVIYPEKEPFNEKVISMYQKYMEDEKLGNLIKRIRNVK